MYPPIQNLRAFVAVADSGQFRSAAERVGVSESAVSHQIARLEAHLGVQLLARGRNGARLTEAGHLFYSHIANALREIEAGLLAIKPQPNRITLSAPPTLSSLWLAHNLASFYDAHPLIDLQMIATNRVCNLKTEMIDFALRRGNGPWEGYQHEFFCTEDIFPVACASLHHQIRTMPWAHVIEHVPLIMNDLHPEEWEQWSAITGSPLPKGANFRHFGSYDQVQAAILGDVGIGMARTPLCLEALSDGRLYRLDHTQMAQTNSYQIVWNAERRLLPPQKAFLVWLRAMKPTSCEEQSR